MKSIRVPLQVDMEEAEILDEICDNLKTSRNQAIRMMIRNEGGNPRLVETHTPAEFRHVAGKYGKAVEVARKDGRKLHFYIHPYRTRCIVLLLDPEDHLKPVRRDELQGESMLIDRILDLQGSEYDWETPEFLTLCADLGLDVNEHAPRYVPEYEWIATGLLNRQKQFPANSNHWELILDFLDLLRVDKDPDLSILNRALNRYNTLSSKEKPDIYRQAIEAAESRNLTSSLPIKTSIHFLPSWSDCIGLVTVSLWEGDKKYCDKDGWCAANNVDLMGVAAMPPMEKLSKTQTIVLNRLAEQGVTVLKTYEIEDYLRGEGAYWSWRNKNNIGRFKMPRLLRSPTTSEIVKWSLRKPATPLYDAWMRRYGRA